MRILQLTLAFLVFGLSYTTAQGLPPAPLFTLDGEEVKLKDYVKDDKLTVLSFWATWCSPCKKELDNIAPLYDEWKEKYNVEVIAITIDNARALPRVKPMVSAKGWEYTILSDKNEDLKRALNFQSVPFTIVTNSKGEILYQHSGYVEGDEYELEDHLKELAGK